MTDATDPIRLRAALLHPRYWGRWLGIGLLSALCLLPARAVDQIGALVGRFCYRCYEKHRRQAELNIDRCFSELDDDARESLLREHFIAYWQTLLQTPVLWWGNREKFARRVNYEGCDVFEAARTQGPVVVLACHSIALDFGAAAIAWRYSAVSMYRPFKHPVDNWLVFRGRERFNNHLVPRGASMRTLVRMARDGTPCYHMPDEDLGREGAVFAPFFGHPKATVLGMGKLTSATRASVVPCYPFYAGNGRFTLRFLDPLENFPDTDEVKNSTLVNEVIEQMIRISPKHYLWKLRLFKTRADGGPNPYD